MGNTHHVGVPLLHFKISVFTLDNGTETPAKETYLFFAMKDPWASLILFWILSVMDLSDLSGKLKQTFGKLAHASPGLKYSIKIKYFYISYYWHTEKHFYNTNLGTNISEFCLKI